MGDECGALQHGRRLSSWAKDGAATNAATCRAAASVQPRRHSHSSVCCLCPTAANALTPHRVGILNRPGKAAARGCLKSTQYAKFEMTPGLGAGVGPGAAFGWERKRSIPLALSCRVPSSFMSELIGASGRSLAWLGVPFSFMLREWAGTFQGQGLSRFGPHPNKGSKLSRNGLRPSKIRLILNLPCRVRLRRQARQNPHRRAMHLCLPMACSAWCYNVDMNSRSHHARRHDSVPLARNVSPFLEPPCSGRCFLGPFGLRTGTIPPCRCPPSHGLITGQGRWRNRGWAG